MGTVEYELECLHNNIASACIYCILVTSSIAQCTKYYFNKNYNFDDNIASLHIFIKNLYPPFPRGWWLSRWLAWDAKQPPAAIVASTSTMVLNHPAFCLSSLIHSNIFVTWSLIFCLTDSWWCHLLFVASNNKVAATTAKTKECSFCCGSNKV